MYDGYDADSPGGDAVVAGLVGWFSPLALIALLVLPWLLPIFLLVGAVGVGSVVLFFLRPFLNLG